MPVRLDSNAAEGEASDAGRGGRGWEYRFSDDDFYLHLVSHAFKHYDASGCGIRFLVDQLVFLRARGKGLDRPYLADELSKLGLRDFEQWTRRLSFRALEDPRAACRCAQGRDAERGPAQKTAGLSDADQARLLRLMNGGTYGTWQTVMERRLEPFAQTLPTMTLMSRSATLQAACSSARSRCKKPFRSSGVMHGCVPCSRFTGWGGAWYATLKR